jgi:hypothetical protein
MKGNTYAVIQQFLKGLSSVVFGLLVIAAIPLGPTAIGQMIGTGAIQGTISDSAGASVQNATITAVESATGYTATRRTNNFGFYVLSALPPGDYTVTMSSTGFATSVQNHVVVNALATVGLNRALSVGSVQQDVQVSAQVPQLDTSDGSLGLTIPTSTYSELPLSMNGLPKDPLGFVTLLPGTSTAGDMDYTFNGGAGNSSALYVNGMPAATPALQSDTRDIYIATSTEDVDQFQAITSGVPAYYAGQGIANLVLKSGTNRFHGDIYENIRNTIFDAAGYFATSTPVEHQNELGGSIGGPVLKNRLFFFFNYDHYAFRAGSNPLQYTIPTVAERTGDFSAFPTPIYDPASTVCSVSGVCTRTQFSYQGRLNVIPPDRISSISQSLQSYLPNPQNTSIQQNYAPSSPGGIDQNMYLGKADWTITPINHLYNIIQYGKQPQVGLTQTAASELPLPYTSSRSGFTSIFIEQVGDTATITNNLVNVLSYQYNHFDTIYLNLTIGGNYPQKAGLTGLPPGQASEAFPEIYFAGPDAPTYWAASNSAGSLDEHAYANTIQDNLQWTHGRHNLTVGTQIVYQGDGYTIYNLVTALNFNNIETANFDSSGNVLTNTGNSYASYLLGDVDSGYATDNSISSTEAHFENYAAYAQDDWKVTKNLVINAGLRYMIAKPYVLKGNTNSWLDPTAPNPEVDGYPGTLEFDGFGTDSCHCRTQIQTHYLELDPRVGFAYSVTPQAVIRGSYTINHYDVGALGGNAGSEGVSLQGYSNSPVFSSPNSGITPAFDWNSGFPAYQLPPFYSSTLGTGYNTTTGATGGSIGYNRPNTAGKQAYTENWNLTLQQQLAPSTVWSLSYSGSVGHFLPVDGGYGIYSDQLNPEYMQLGNLLLQTETPTTLAEAQSIIPSIKLPYANFDGAIAQMLRPFPQFAAMGDAYADFGNEHYNSLQTYIQHSMSKGLYFLLSYTWGREFDDSGAGTLFFLDAVPRSAYNLAAESSAGTADTPQIISLAYVYSLPFGKGHAIGNNHNLLSSIIGGWEVSGIQTYSSGTPLGPFGANCLLPDAANCYADYAPGFQGHVRINGPVGSGDVKAGTPYLNINAFQNPASFSFGDTPRTLAYGLRTPWNPNESLSLQRTFDLHKGLTAKFRVDAFNVFNRTVFGDLNTDIASSGFGSVAGQVNSPRNLQFEAYIKF